MKSYFLNKSSKILFNLLNWSHLFFGKKIATLLRKSSLVAIRIKIFFWNYSTLTCCRVAGGWTAVSVSAALGARPTPWAWTGLSPRAGRATSPTPTWWTRTSRPRWSPGPWGSPGPWRPPAPGIPMRSWQRSRRFVVFILWSRRCDKFCVAGVRC